MAGSLHIKAPQGGLHYDLQSQSAQVRNLEVRPNQSWRLLRQIPHYLSIGEYLKTKLQNTKHTWGERVGSAFVGSDNPAWHFPQVCAPWTRNCSSLGLEKSPVSLGKSLASNPPKDMAAVETARRGSTRPTPTVGGPISGMIHRPSLVENVRTASANSVGSTGSASGLPSAMAEEKPIASGNGVSLSIALAEPVLFLQGFDHAELGNQNTSMLRGSFHLRVSKTAKIKTVSLAFRGRAETEWPEGLFVHGPSELGQQLTMWLRSPPEEDRIQRQRKYHESHMALLQCPISDSSIWLWRRPSEATQGPISNNDRNWRHRILRKPSQTANEQQFELKRCQETLAAGQSI